MDLKLESTCTSAVFQCVVPKLRIFSKYQIANSGPLQRQIPSRVGLRMCKRSRSQCPISRDSLQNQIPSRGHMQSSDIIQRSTSQCKIPITDPLQSQIPSRGHMQSSDIIQGSTSQCKIRRTDPLQSQIPSRGHMQSSDIIQRSTSQCKIPRTDPLQSQILQGSSAGINVL
jgi:hypothetical protein